MKNYLKRLPAMSKSPEIFNPMSDVTVMMTRKVV